MLQVINNADAEAPDGNSFRTVPQIVLPPGTYKNTKSQGHKLIAAHNILPGFGGECSMMLPFRWAELDAQIWASRFDYSELPYKPKLQCATAISRGIRMQCRLLRGEVGTTAIECCNDLVDRATKNVYSNTVLLRRLFQIVPATKKWEEKHGCAYVIFSIKAIMSGLADINIMNKLETNILLLGDGHAPDLLVSHR